MSVSDIQSGMGIHTNRARSTEYNSDEELPSQSTGSSNRLSDEPKTLYTTKAEQRKREMKEKAEQPLNSMCNCGSNKKYKNCCMKKL
jgi:hypothetical protein